MLSALGRCQKRNINKNKKESKKRVSCCVQTNLIRAFKKKGKEVSAARKKCAERVAAARRSPRAMKHTAEKRARKHWGFAGRQTTFTRYTSREMTFFARGNIACARKKRVCAHARGQVARCSAHGRRVDSLHCVARGGGEVCCCARIGRMQQLFSYARAT